MGTTTGPLKSAHLVGIMQGAVTAEDGTRRAFEYLMHEGSASQGYKSDYDRVPTRWITVRFGSVAAGAPRWHRNSWRYSGGRLPLARKHYDQAERDLVAAGAEFSHRSSGDLT